MWTVADSDGRAFEAVAETPAGRVTVMAEAALDGRVLVLRRFHVDGPGPGSLGPAAVRALAVRAMEDLDVDELVIDGWRRETGAGPGRWPPRLRFRRPGDRPGGRAAEQGPDDAGLA